MDYQEALEKHEKDCRRCREKICKYAIKKFSCLQEIDIKAYEELMSYRRIGTLKEFKELKECQLSGIELSGIAFCLKLLKDYQQLGTLEEVREAVEKQKAKKPIEDRHHGIRYTEVYRCPSCNGSFSGKGFAKYCFHCGKRIDWSEEE